MTDTNNIYAAGSSNLTITSAGTVSTLSAPNGIVNIGSNDAGTLTAGTLTAGTLSAGPVDSGLTVDGDTGYVGIGTNDPTALLTFPPRTTTSGSATRVLIEMPSVRHDSNFKIYNDDTDGEAKLTLAYYNPNFTHVMTWQHSGNIGIGTWTPRYPLEVQGRKAVEYFDSYTHKGNWHNSGQYHPVSIATDRIGLNYVIWYSDRRIKKDFELVNDDKALKQVNNLQSYEYNYIDPDRMTEQKVIGFIAQEVKDVIPNAVSIDKNFIPDEMRIIENLQWSQFTDATGNNKFKLEINDIDFSGNFTGQCKFYVSNDSKGKNEICKIIMIEDDKKSFIFDERWITVFFYGKEVTDFHNVDKAQIFSLHHSAIQELSRKHDAVVQENASLKERLAAIEAKLGM